MNNRYVFNGTPPLTKEIKKGGVPTGDLMPGETGIAFPCEVNNPEGFWEFTSDRGFTMIVPPHDIQGC